MLPSWVSHGAALLPHPMSNGSEFYLILSGMGEAFQLRLMGSLPKYKIILFSRAPQTWVSFLLQNSSMRCVSCLKNNPSCISIKQSLGKTSFGLKAQFSLTSVVVVNAPCFLQIGWSSSNVAPRRNWAATGKSLAWLASITLGRRDNYCFSWAPLSCLNHPFFPL